MLTRPRQCKPLSVFLFAVLATVLMLPGAERALAVQPGRWVNATESDFEPGDAQGTVVTNLGDIRLAAKSEDVVKLDDPSTIVYDLQRVGDTTYAAAGPQAVLLKWDGEQADQVLKLEDEQVFALARYDGKLLVGVSGEKTSRLGLLDGDKLTTIAKLPDARYVWDLLVTDKGILVATGTEGRVLRVKPAKSLAAAQVETVFDAKQSNVLCLAAAPASASGKDKVIYAGTDTQGLVYRLTPDVGDADKYDAFVLFDAAEPEIATLLVTEDGTLYAGTADAEQAKPGRLNASQSQQTGRNTPEVPPPGKPGIGDTPPPQDMTLSPKNRKAPPKGLGDAPAAEASQKSEDPPSPVRPSRPEAGRSAVAADGTDDASNADAPLAEDQPDPDEQDGQGQSAEDANPHLPEKTAKPTTAQYDRLRAMVKQRLESARESGQLAAPSGASSAGETSSARRSKARPAPATAGPPAQGNAVYRIDPQGFSREVFRESVMILRLAMHHDKLIVATGNEGQVFSVHPDTGETAVLADLDAQQVPALLARGEHLLLGTANPGELRTLGRAVEAEGTYTSAIFDAKQTSLWGHLSLTAKLPRSASITVETRTGNVKDPEDAPWSKWSKARALNHDDHVNALTPRRIEIPSPPARFLQYRLTLHAGADADHTSPVVHRVTTTYITPNLAPKITSFTAAYPDADPNSDTPPDTKMNLSWEASDANEDRLTYTIEYRKAGSKRWLKIEDKLTDTSHSWETRRVPDGRYLLRVRADDALDNPPDMAKTVTRRSDAVLVDNTAPRLVHLKLAGRKITATGRDGFSAIERLAYAVNDEEQYHPILPNDLIADSTSEKIAVTLPDSVKPGDVVTLRVSDTRGNTRYRSLVVSHSTQ